MKSFGIGAGAALIAAWAMGSPPENVDGLRAAIEHHTARLFAQDEGRAAGRGVTTDFGLLGIVREDSGRVDRMSLR